MLAKTRDIQELVDRCRDLLEHVPHDYLILIPMSFSNQDSRLFEMKTTELLVDQCGFDGLHLGGANQPLNLHSETEGKLWWLQNLV